MPWVRVAVVGHTEWVQFVKLDRVPKAGEIVHAADAWEEVGGGGAVAAVQLRKLAGEADFFTALSEDDVGLAALARLEALGVTPHVAWRAAPQRRAVTHLDAEGERTITIIGERLAPKGADALAWERLRDTEAVYFTAGDLGALRHARAARVLVATPRARDALLAGKVPLDALVGSADDEGERLPDGALRPPPRLEVATQGVQGGRYVEAEGRSGSWEAATLPGEIADAYGCGDSFAAGLTYGLAIGRDVDYALELAARCGAACLTGQGPYEGQLELGRDDRGSTPA